MKPKGVNTAHELKDIEWFPIEILSSNHLSMYS